MTTVDPDFNAADAEKEARRARMFTRINKADRWFQVLGLSWITPVLKAAAGDNPKAQMSEIWRLLGVPILAILGFLMLWGTLAPTVQTSLGAIPGPAQVWVEAKNLHQDALAKAESKADFEAKVAQLNERRLEQGKEPVERAYTGAPSYYQQIWTSIKTVFFGFLIASIVAIPLGIAAGLSPTA
ncbi:MAG: ABC transporter permease, partial [Pseudomonadota bacterium]